MGQGVSLRARHPLRGLYTEETEFDMIRLLRSGSYDRYPIGVTCPFASMVLEFVAVSLAKPVFIMAIPFRRLLISPSGPEH